MGVNEFSDLTHDEFKKVMLGPKIPIKTSAERNEVWLPEDAAADSVDWRTKGAVTPVKNQVRIFFVEVFLHCKC